MEVVGLAGTGAGPVWVLGRSGDVVFATAAGPGVGLETAAVPGAGVGFATAPVPGAAEPVEASVAMGGVPAAGGEGSALATAEGVLLGAADAAAA